MLTLDHVGFAVADYQRSKAFYEKALAPLGLTLLTESPKRRPGSAETMEKDRRSSSRPTGSRRMGGFTLRWELRVGRKWTPSTPRRSRRVGLTTARPA